MFYMIPIYKTKRLYTKINVVFSLDNFLLYTFLHSPYLQMINRVIFKSKEENLKSCMYGF